MRSVVAVTALAAGVIGLAAGCSSAATSSLGGSSSPTRVPVAGGGAGGGAGSGSVRPSPSGAGASAGGAMSSCPLTVSVDATQAGVAMGTTFYPVEFTNSGSAACTLDGYPGVSFVTASGSAGTRLGAAATRDESFSPVPVRLGPGGHAHAWLEVGSAANYPAAVCAARTTHWLRVYPPSSGVPGYVRRDFTACTATSAQQLSVTPIRAGTGSRGSTP